MSQNNYSLMFSSKEEIHTSGKTLFEAVHTVRKSYNMLGLVRFSKNGGSYQEIPIQDRGCACFKHAGANIPCRHDLEHAEQGCT